MTDFDQFWALYPRKAAKKDAEKAWKKLSPTAAVFDQILVALSWQRVSPQWLQANGQYIPYPATWLRGERWNDDIPRQQMRQPDWVCPHTPACLHPTPCHRLQAIAAEKARAS